MRARTRTMLTALAAAAAALGSLLPTSAGAATPVSAAVAAPLTSAPSAVAATLPPAPHVPGARRFDGTIAGNVRQVIVVSAASWSSTVGTATLYSRSGAGWHLVARWPARLGYGGLVVGSRRVQGSGTTPAGSYAITTSFGRQANPGTRLPFVKVDDDQWWVEDRHSAYYNQMRRASLGGFAVTTRGIDGSEHLLRMGSQYDYVAVIDFNRPNPVIGRGAGIFLHAYGSGSTAGCVAVSWSHMRAALRWLGAWAHPRIIIGPASWLGA